MFIGTGTNNDFRKIVRSGMEPFVWSPIRHAAPDGAWFSGGGGLSYKHAAPTELRELGSRGVRLSYKHAAPTELWPTGRPRQLRHERHVYSNGAAGTPPAP